MTRQQEKRAVMLEQSPGRLMASLSLPGIVGMLVIGLYTFVDAIYAGQLIGVDAMGAVSVAYPFTFVSSGLAAMIGMGVGFGALSRHRRVRPANHRKGHGKPCGC